jgi:hypothetical protein
MISKTYAIVIFTIEIVLFLTELWIAVRDQFNRKLKRANNIEDVDFLDMNQGYKTSVSYFRISLFLAYLILAILYFDAGKSNLFEAIVLYVLAGILIYMLSLLNIKTFIFYPDYFIVSAPFNFFRKETLISYSTISDFRLYRALYNNFILELRMKTGEINRIQFSGSAIPRNNLVVRIILNSKTGLKKDFIRKRWKKKNDSESHK